MHYLFLDESYSTNPSSNTVTVAAWIVEQSVFDDFTSRSRELYRTPVLNSINSMLESLGGWALVSRSSLDKGIYRVGERDSTDDVVEMARPDNVWSQCVIFTTGMLIRELIRRNIDVSVLDVYHDPKALKRDHAGALAQTLRGVFVSLAKQFTADRNIPWMKNLSIGRIEPIEKPTNDPPTRYQVGTWVADRLCALACKKRSVEYSRIIRRDMSDLVRRTVQQFDGKPF